MPEAKGFRSALAHMLSAHLRFAPLPAATHKLDLEAAQEEAWPPTSPGEVIG